MSDAAESENKPYGGQEEVNLPRPEGLADLETGGEGTGLNLSQGGGQEGEALADQTTEERESLESKPRGATEPGSRYFELSKKIEESHQEKR